MNGPCSLVPNFLPPRIRIRSLLYRPHEPTGIPDLLLHTNISPCETGGEIDSLDHLKRTRQAGRLRRLQDLCRRHERYALHKTIRYTREILKRRERDYHCAFAPEWPLHLYDEHFQKGTIRRGWDSSPWERCARRGRMKLERSERGSFPRQLHCMQAKYHKTIRPGQEESVVIQITNRVMQCPLHLETVVPQLATTTEQVVGDKFCKRANTSDCRPSWWRRHIKHISCSESNAVLLAIDRAGQL